MKVNLSDQDERERSWESCRENVLEAEIFRREQDMGESNIIWRRRPAGSEKEKVSEEVLVGFAAESWRCPRPRDTWWVPTLPLPWFSTMV